MSHPQVTIYPYVTFVIIHDSPSNTSEHWKSGPQQTTGLANITNTGLTDNSQDFNFSEYMNNGTQFMDDENESNVFTIDSKQYEIEDLVSAYSS